MANISESNFVFPYIIAIWNRDKQYSKTIDWDQHKKHVRGVDSDTPKDEQGNMKMVGIILGVIVLIGAIIMFKR